MSSLVNETLLTIPEAAKRLGKWPNCIRSWIRRGLLECIELPCGQHTSVEAIERMSDKLAKLRQATWTRSDRLPSTSANERAAKRQHREAVKVLKKMGVA